VTRIIAVKARLRYAMSNDQLGTPVVSLSSVDETPESFFTAEGAESAEFLYRFLCELGVLCGKIRPSTSRGGTGRTPKGGNG